MLNPNNKRVLENNEQQLRKKAKPSRIIILLKEYKKWSSSEVIAVLKMDDDIGGVGLSDEKVQHLRNIDGVTIDHIIKNIGKNDDFAINKLLTNNDFWGVSESTCTSIVYWVRDNIIPLIGYDEWSSEEVAQTLCKKKVHGGANIALPSLRPLIDSNFNGEHLNIIVDHLKLDDEHDVIIKVIEDSLNIQFNDDINRTMKSIISWVEKHLIFIIGIVPRYEPWNYEIAKENDKFTIEEIEWLERISKLELYDLSKPEKQGVDRLKFDLKNRQNAIEVIKDVAVRQYIKSQQDEITKQDMIFLIAKGGSGSGKSRILTEINNILLSLDTENESINNIYKYSSIIYFNFANGFPLDINNERDFDPIAMICSRIMYSAFNSNIQLPKISKRIFLFELIRIISKKLHERFNIDSIIPIPLVIALDEYQLATRFIKNLHTSLQHHIGWYMREIQKYHGLIILPVLGGTLTESDAKFEPTHYTSKQIPLPSLRPQDIENIMKKEEVISLYTGKYKYFWDLIGVVPRHLEWAIGEAKLLNNLLSIPI